MRVIAKLLFSITILLAATPALASSDKSGGMAAEELNPKMAEYYYHRGNVYYHMDKYDDAIRDYDLAIKLRRNYAGAYYNRGLAFDGKGLLRQALGDVGERHVEHAADVAHHGLGLHRPEGNDRATFSRPYLRVTYSMTSPRRRSQKSMSMSGSTRSGLRKRSKIRSNSIGSTSVMFRHHATTLPAADPRPGPTGMPAARARSG